MIELIILIVVTSILAVAILASMTKQTSDKAISFNDISLIVNNTEETFKSWIHLVGPDGITGTPAAAIVNNFSTECVSLPSPSVICRNVISDTVKYQINATTTSNSISASPLSSVNAWTVTFNVVFSTRATASASWVEYLTVNKSFMVLQ